VNHNQLLLFKAVEEGESGKVQSLLAGGVSTSIWNEEGLTPLLLAMEKKHYPVVALLLAGGADASIPSRAGLTPLGSAIIGTAPDLVKMLLEHNADPNQVVMRKFFPLHLAITVWTQDASVDEKVEIVRLLVGKGSSINAANSFGCTSLDEAWIVLSQIVTGEKTLRFSPDGSGARHAHSSDETARVSSAMREIITILTQRGAMMSKIGEGSRVMAQLSETPEGREKLKELLARQRGGR
jgi:hypothetical protein